ncbi:asparaginase [Oscillatoria amoena NRMC-F 0135]|nr:asparaginase [Oscillatoria amoena NRMC-F 0135]
MNFKRADLESYGAPRARLLIIYTGGTFGMTHDKDGALIPFDFASILEHLPTVKSLGLAFSVFSFEDPIDSSNVQPEHWQLIGQLIYEHYDAHDGFVILHGTDTMAYTASALSFMLENLAKPVVLTGAQLPISEPRSDARENLITALEIASAKEKSGKAVVPEVCIYFDYQLLRGNRSKKVESMQFDAFDSGNYPALAKAGVKMDYNYAAIRRPGSGSLKLHTRFEPQVAILKLFPGISKQVFQSVLSIEGLKAVILETYGSGNAPTIPWLISGLEEATRKGILVLNVSQCPGGTVMQGRYATSRELVKAGVLSGADMTTEAAVTKLMLLFGRYDGATARVLIQQDLAGELTE